MADRQARLSRSHESRPGPVTVTVTVRRRARVTVTGDYDTVARGPAGPPVPGAQCRAGPAVTVLGARLTVTAAAAVT